MSFSFFVLSLHWKIQTYGRLCHSDDYNKTGHDLQSIEGFATHKIVCMTCQWLSRLWLRLVYDFFDGDHQRNFGLQEHGIYRSTSESDRLTLLYLVTATEKLVVVVVVVLLGNPTGLSWPNSRDSEIFLQLLPESVQRRS